MCLIRIYSVAVARQFALLKHTPSHRACVSTDYNAI